MSVLLYLGEFVFAPRGDGLTGMSRKSKARLAPQELIQRIAPVQFVGPGARTISIEGVIRPEYQGGLGQIEAMHQACDDGAPRVLTTGYGHVLGEFMIESIAEKRKYLAAYGIPRKIEFSIDLMRCPSAGGLFGLW